MSAKDILLLSWYSSILLLSQQSADGSILYQQRNSSTPIRVSRLADCENPITITIYPLMTVEVFGVDAFENFTSLQKLTIRNNNLSRLIDGTFNATKNLTHLNLENNFLEINAGGCFDGLVNLEDIRLSKNCLHCLPTDLFKDMAHLKIICLDNNHLQTLDLNVFIGMENLNLVALQRNFISTIKSSRTLVGIKELTLRENKLTDISALKMVRNLTFVNLSDNLELILDSMSFENCRGLEMLSLNNVTLARYENFYEYFKPLKHLRALSIGKNNLTNINVDELGHLRNLETLTIDMNNLDLFDFDAFLRTFRRIVTVKIGGNNLGSHENAVFSYEIGDSVRSRPIKNCTNHCKTQQNIDFIAGTDFVPFILLGALLTSVFDQAMTFCFFQ